MPDPAVFSPERKVSLAAAIARLTSRSVDNASAEVFRHGMLQVRIYAPHGRDPQAPHSRDEVYVVARGRGVFVHGTRQMPVDAGDLLFAAAGEIHRFEAFSTDFAVWVFFYGPEGGERSPSPAAR